MKKGINQCAFDPHMKLEDAFRLARDAGFDGIELNLQAAAFAPLSAKPQKESLVLTLESQKDKVEKVKELAERYGVELPSLSTDLFWKYSLTSDDEEERQRALDVARKMMEVAGWLGADTILLVPGVVDVPWLPGFQPLRYDVVYERSLSALQELRFYAEERRITIGLENVWNKFLLSPLEMRHFVDEIGSEFVGVYLDVGNVLLTGYPEHWIDILGLRIKRVHVKDFRKLGEGSGTFVGLLQGDADWAKVVTALRQVGYTSYLTAELRPYRFHNERLIYETARAIDAIIRN